MTVPTERPLDAWLRNYEREQIRIAQILGKKAETTASPQPRHIVPPSDALGRLATDNPEVFNLIGESLIARGALASLAALNTASYPLYEATLPLLWRTFVWDAYGKGKAKADEYWKRFVASRGAEHIR